MSKKRRLVPNKTSSLEILMSMPINGGFSTNLIFLGNSAFCKEESISELIPWDRSAIEYLLCGAHSKDFGFRKENSLTRANRGQATFVDRIKILPPDPALLSKGLRETVVGLSFSPAGRGTVCARGKPPLDWSQNLRYLNRLKISCEKPNSICYAFQR